AVSWTVTNAGTGAGRTADWTDAVIASVDGIAGNGDDIELAQFPHHAGLDAGSSYTQSQTILLPPSLEGRFHLFVRTDADNAVFENGSEGNNLRESGAPFDVVSRPFADLIVESVTAPASGASGQPLTVTWSVVNQGIGATDGADWVDRLDLAQDSSGANVVAHLADFTHNGVLAVGGSYSRAADVTLPNGLAGTFFVVVSTGGPFEFIHTDNNPAVSAAVAVTLSPAPDLNAIATAP